jgi:hypothetical protein
LKQFSWRWHLSEYALLSSLERFEDDSLVRRINPVLGQRKHFGYSRACDCEREAKRADRSSFRKGRANKSLAFSRDEIFSGPSIIEQ